jgi:aminomethyltransferase
LREVPLVELHRRYGGSLGEFGGWLTSLDFGDPVAEHLAVRRAVAFFDVSHMGRFVLRGRRVLDFLQRLFAKDLSGVGEGYMSGPALLLNEDAGMIDDVMLYRVREDLWYAVVNAPRISRDFEWLSSWRGRLGFSDVEIEDVTDSTTLIAIQGPKALEVVENLGVREAGSLRILQFVENVEVLGGRATLVSRSGWTGEEVRSHGFEIWAPVELGRRIFEKLVELGVRPAGLIARDMLRLEAGYLLSGVDFDESTNPIEARYWMAFDLDKRGYVGYEKLEARYREGVERVRVGLRFKKGVRVVPRHGDPIVVGGTEVGRVTSGTYSTYLERAIAMGYVSSRYAYIGGTVHVSCRGKLYEAKIVEPPFI